MRVRLVMTNNERYAELEAKVKENNQLIEQLERDIKNADYLTLRAEFANYKNESNKIIEGSQALGKEEVIEEVAKFINEFDKLIDLDVTDKKYSKKLNKFNKEIEKLIKQLGLEEIDCKGKLDHNVHYAVMTDYNTDLEDDQITEVLQKGYIINDTMVRPAMVKVNKL